MDRGNTALSDGTWFKTINSPVQIFLCPLLDSDWNLVELLVLLQTNSSYEVKAILELI